MAGWTRGTNCWTRGTNCWTQCSSGPVVTDCSCNWPQYVKLLFTNVASCGATSCSDCVSASSLNGEYVLEYYSCQTTPSQYVKYRLQTDNFLIEFSAFQSGASVSAFPTVSGFSCLCELAFCSAFYGTVAVGNTSGNFCSWVSNSYESSVDNSNSCLESCTQSGTDGEVLISANS